MKYIDINKAYTEKVAEYMAKGYTINSSSMTGSQGEIAKIDLTDGKEIIRISLDEEDIFDDNGRFEAIVLTVGRSTDSDVKPNSCDNWHTIWNEHLEISETSKFYQLYETRGAGPAYGSYEEAVEMQNLKMERYRNRDRIGSDEKDITNERTVEIVIPAIRRKLNVNRVIRSRVRIRKDTKTNRYTVSYGSKSFVLA